MFNTIGPVLVVILCIGAAWLALIVAILMFFHGASKLRREGRRGRVRHGNLPKSWPDWRTGPPRTPPADTIRGRRRRPLDAEATVTYISGERKEGNR